MQPHPKKELYLNVLPNYANPEGMPAYNFLNDSGFDLHASPREDECPHGYISVAPQERKLIRTGLRMLIPAGYEIQIRSRSGQSVKSGLTVLNAPGTVDSQFLDELQVLVYNNNRSLGITIARGDRIAQAVLAPVEQADFTLLTNEEFNNISTARGTGGWGHTGQSG